MSESSGRAGAPWALWGLVVASVLLPLLVFAGGGWLAWRGTVREANASLSSALAVSEEQATRVFDTHVLLGGRVNDLLGDLDDDAVIARERELHDRLAAMIAGYSQVTAILVTGADGRALVATSRFPTDHRVSFSDRGYFIALRDGDAPFQIGGVVYGRVTRADVFTVAVRRGGTGKDFGGAILVGVSPSYFSRFDSELFGGDTDYTALLLREDGTPLAGYPEPTPAEAQPARPVAGRRHRPPATGRPGSRHLVGRRHRARDRLSPADELSGLRHHRPPLEFGGRRMARRHGDASGLRHSGNVGPARTQPSGNAAVAAAARYAGAAAGRGSPPRSGRGGAAPIAEDGSGGSAHRRHRARLQQPPDGDQQQHRTAAATAAAGQRLAHPADRCGDGRRAARRDADASAARVLAAAAVGTGADRCQPAGVEHVRPAASDVGRAHRDRDRARRWTVADAGRCEPTRERAAQPRGERARRDADSAAG